MENKENNNKYPYIIITNIEGNILEIQQNLLKKGFNLIYTLKEQNKYILIIEVSLKLHIKLAIQYNYPIKNRIISEESDITRIIYHSIHILKRMNLKYHSIWVMSQTDKLASLGNKSSNGLDLNNLNSYFGSQITLYFAWMAYYCHFLTIPAIFGVILFIHQLYTGEIDNIWTTYFMLLISIWSTLFLEHWKQRNASLAYSWGVLEADEERKLSFLLNNNNSNNDSSTTSPTSSKKSKSKYFSPYFITIPFILVLMLIMISLMIYFMSLMDNARLKYGPDSLLQYWPTIVYSLFPVIAGYLFDQVVVILNDFENHPPENEEDALIMKQFAFQFVNRYCVLIYAVFYLKDFHRLRTLLASMLITNALLDNVLEVFTPTLIKFGIHVRDKYKIKQQSNASSSVQFTLKSEGKSWIDTITNEEADKLWKRQIIDELSREEYNLRSDYMEMMIQYGYVTMFAAVFPIAPALALVNNLMEIKVDFLRLSNCRRPDLVDRSSLNGWITCLTILGFTSVFTNSFLLCLVSKNIHSIVPTQYLSMVQTDFSRFVLLVIVEHSLLALNVLLSNLIEDVPRWVQEMQAQEAERIRKKLATERLVGYKIQDIPIEDQENNLIDYERNTIASRISNFTSHFGYSPTLIIPLISTPSILNFFHLPAYLYAPISMIFLALIKSDKDKQDNKSALGIVWDSNIRKYMEKEIPEWIRNSDNDRVQWLNAFLEKLWPYISLSTEAVLKTIPLQSYHPLLKFSEITLGSIPPNIVSIKYCHTEENCVRLDLDVKWAGNPKIGITVGSVKSSVVELSDITFSGLIRLELNPLFPRFPCFGGIDLTFLEKPFIDFSLKLTSFNLMNIGVDEFNSTALVNSIVHLALSNLMVYPHKYKISIVLEQDIKAVSAKIPVGLLKLTIFSVEGLKPSEFMTTDPFVQFTVQNIEYKTQILKNTISPVWNETFYVMIFEKQTESIEFLIADDDITSLSIHTFGYAILKLDSIPAFEVVNRELILETEEEREERLKRLKSSSEKEKNGLFDFNLDINLNNPLDMLDSFKKSASPSKKSSKTSSNVNDEIQNELQNSGKKNNKQKPKLKIICEYLPLKQSGKLSDNPSSSSSTSTPTSETENESLKVYQTDILFDMAPQNLTREVLNEEVIIMNTREPINDLSTVVTEAQKYEKLKLLSQKTELSNKTPGVLTVSGIKGKNFKIDNSVLTTVRPFIIFSIGTTKHQTIVQKDYSNPNYDESFNFVVLDPSSTLLSVKVMHDNILKGNSLLGEVSIRLHDIVKHNGSVDKEYPLNSKYEEMSISCRLQWSSVI